MNIKLDENLPHQLVQLLSDLGHDVDTVRDESIAGRDDDVVWAAAQTAGRFLVTQDLDFSDARKYAPGTHHGLLLVRLPQPGRSWPDISPVADATPVDPRGSRGSRMDRELVMSPLPYIVVYAVRGDAIFIVRILHGAQQWP